MAWVHLTAICQLKFTDTVHFALCCFQNIVLFIVSAMNTYCTNNNIAVCTCPRVLSMAAIGIIFDSMG
jgi:hypothetical protein